MKRLKDFLAPNTPPAQKPGTHQVALATDIGRVHQVNQDAGGAWTWSSHGTPVSLLVVADGVSAGRRSEEASRLVVRIISERVMEPGRHDEPSLDRLATGLMEAVREANERITARARAGEGHPPATTLVAALCVDGRCSGVWCGDSRAYKISGDQVSLLTRDHSWAEEAVERGALTPEQADSDPRSHMITRWLGASERQDPGIERFRCDVEPGDAILLCTDGLFDLFRDSDGPDELSSVISSHRGDPKGAASELISNALRRGGHDNITVAILQRYPGAA